MSISTLDSLTSVRMLADMARRDDALEAAQAQARADFALMCARGDLSARCEWAPAVIDYDATKAYGLPPGQYVRRAPTAARVLADSFDYTGGPSYDDLLQLALDAANGKPVEDKAQSMLHAAGEAWVRMNVEVRNERADPQR